MNSFFQYVNTEYPILLEVCRNSSHNKLFRETIDNYHSYVKYKDSPTRNIRYLVYESKSGNHIGAVGISSASIGVSCRDSYIGWDVKTKICNLNKVANNSRFCIIQQNVTIRNASSMTLKMLRMCGSKDWKSKYNDDLILMETFVQPHRDTEYNGHLERNGSVYKADNWIEVGMTSGHSIRKSPILMWAKENGERGRLAREDPEKCIIKYSKYLGDHNKSGYKIESTHKKIVFIRPMVYNWKVILNSI